MGVGELAGVRRGNVVAFSVIEDGEEQLVIAPRRRAQAAALREEIPKRVLDEIGLQPFKVELVALGTLPKTSSGKPQRRKTKALWASGQFVASTHAAASSRCCGGRAGDMRMTRTELIGLFEKTATEIAERDIKGLSELTEISTLGIDSLGILELVGEMEKQLGIQLPDDQLVGLTKIGDLLDLVEKRRQLAS